VKALSEKLQETRAKVAPKSRFAFKTSHKNGSAISLNDAAELAQAQRLGVPSSQLGFDSSTESSIATTPAHLKTPSNETDTLGELPRFSKNYNEEIGRALGGPIRQPSFSQASSVSISDHTGLHIILPSSASHATSSGSLTNLNKCIVDMSVPTTNGAPFAGLMLKNMKKSLIIAGQVMGAAHITGVEDSVIAVSSRQVRMHDCKNVDVYLMCSSRPIIEDCSRVRFAPIPECYVRSFSFLPSLFESTILIDSDLRIK
jgi:tubulin-specific chaperone C